MIFALEDIVFRRALAGVQLDVSRAIVEKKLGEPDQWSGEAPCDRAVIWRYGTFEIHFTDGTQSAPDRVWLIYSDYVAHHLDAGEGRTIDWGLFADRAMRNYDGVVAALRQRRISFHETRDDSRWRYLAIDSGGRLGFDPRGIWALLEASTRA